MIKVLGVLAAALCFGTFSINAHAELPKSGKVSLYYSWHAFGHMVPLAEGFVV